MELKKIENLAQALINSISALENNNVHYYKGAREGIQELFNAIKKGEEESAADKERKPSLSKVKAEPAKS